MTAAAGLVLLPWVRRGASSALAQPDTFGAGQPGVASTTVTLEVNASPQVPMGLAVMGPGHVTALSSAQVIRMDPTPSSVVFEPNYLALVEFDEASLPWLFTPASAGAQGRLRPWVCLVVVRKQDGIWLGPPDRGSVPVLRIGAPATPIDELPDLADSWAWAHAQVTADSGADVPAVLAGQPDRSLSRLLCGRRLAPNANYLACVVPTFELGRKAGLGLDITDADEARLDPAWTLPAPAVEMPVYHHWEFMTGPGGDFQSLALLLRARPLPDSVGVRDLDVSHSGVDVAVPDGTTVRLGGALKPVGHASSGWPDESVHAAVRIELARLLNVSTAADPMLAPPRYGALGDPAPLDPAVGGVWYEQLNLEAPARVAAQLGTLVVQRHQEALVASAWMQAAELRAVNQVLRHAEFGCAVVTSLHSRHLATMAPDAGLQVLSPALPRLVRSPAAAAFGVMLSGAQLPASAFGTSLRRITRPQGALNRRLARVAGTPGSARTSLVLRSMQPSTVFHRRIVLPTGPATLERVALMLNPPNTDIVWGGATAAAVRDAPPEPTFRLQPPAAAPSHALLPTDGGEPPDDPPPHHPPPHHPPPHDPPPHEPPPHEPPPAADSADAAAFRTAAQAHLARFDPQPPWIFVPPPIVSQVGDVFGSAVTAAAPRQHYVAAISRLVDLPGPTRPDDAALDPIGLTPTFPQPMSLSLAELGQELLLPGLDGVPPNTIVPLETNTPFVEAFLVGLNTELGRELVWRGFPAPAQATYFDRFWDAAVKPGAPRDIPPLADWGDRPLGGTAAGDERFVMLVRSDLLRRYPNAIVYATKPADGMQPARDSHPVFSGAMDPEVRFFGFDIPADEIGAWSIVVQEQGTAPRFGVEVGADPGGGSHLPVTGDAHAARVAARLRQTPVRITIPSSVLLREV